jgi:hypothetical protein
VTRTQPAAASEYLSAYTAIQKRITEVVSDNNCHLSVPACPGWRIHEMLAHLSGLCQDWVDRRLDGYASDGWTAAQVARQTDRSCLQMLAVWEDSLSSLSNLR